jgi:hypothetical protein
VPILIFSPHAQSKSASQAFSELARFGDNDVKERMLKADIQNGPHIERTRWSLSRGRKVILLSAANPLPAPGK